MSTSSSVLSAKHFLWIVPLILILGRILLSIAGDKTTEHFTYLAIVSFGGLGVIIATYFRKILLQQHWWKVLAIILVSYTIIGAFISPVPRQPILNETIRNLHFHVPMWFGQIFILLLSLVYSIKYLRSFNKGFDTIAVSAAKVGMLYGVLGLATGSVWARYTWGAWWTSDPKLNAALVAMLMYLAYFILRQSIDDDEKAAKVSAAYNVIAFFMFNALIFVMPRLMSSLHPGNGGNPGMNAYDLDNHLRMIFYPAVVGWTLVGMWLISLKIRLENVKLTRLWGKEYEEEILDV